MPKFTDLTIKALPEGLHFDDRTPGFGIRVGKQRRTWLVIKGKNRTKVRLGHYPQLSLQDARKRALVALGTPFEPQSVPTFPEALDLFLGAITRRERSQYVLEQSLRKHFTWTRPLDKITHEDVARVIEGIEAPGSRRNALKDIRTFFNWCVPRYLKFSPATGLKMPRYVPRARVLTDDELRQVWATAEQTGYPFGTIVMLLILTGQRRSEIAALQREWITTSSKTDLLAPSQTKTIPSLSTAMSETPSAAASFSNVARDASTTQSQNSSITFPSWLTKNNREHTFPIGTLAVSILSTTETGNSVFIFPARQRQNLHSDGSSNKATSFAGWSASKATFDKRCPIAPWTLHDIRRTYATKMGELGTPIHVTEKLLNHVSGSHGGIVGTYQRFQYWDEQVAAVQRYETALRSLVG